MHHDKKAEKRHSSKSSAAIIRDETANPKKQHHHRERLDKYADPSKKSVKKDKVKEEKSHETKRRHRSSNTSEGRNETVSTKSKQANLTDRESTTRKHEKLRNHDESSRHLLSQSNTKLTEALKAKAVNNNELPLKTSTVPLSAKIHVEQQEYVYEDDFEEYSDDFEDSDDSTTSVSKQKNPDVRLALSSDLPNSPLVSRLLHSRDISYKSHIERKPSQTLIVTSTNANNTGKQYDTLTNLLGMEVVRFEFADIPPINDYEFYMQMFGNDNKIQVQTQTHDDDNHRYIQTEEQEAESKWTQHPPADERGWGVGLTKIAPSLNLNQQDTDIEYFRKRTVDKERLKTFLDIAAEVMIKVTSVSSETMFDPEMKYKSGLPYRLECNKFSIEDIVAKSRVSMVLHHQNTLFVAYFIDSCEKKELLKKTVVAQYDLKNPSVPLRLMICEDEISCACYAAARSDALFSGLKDGSCVAFDLSEPLNHFSNAIEWKGTDFRRLTVCSPAYDTAFRSIGFEDEEDMRSSVIGINAAINASDGNTYQVASISEFGTIFVWAVSKVEQQDSLVDLGLRPGAKLKMSLASIIRLSATCSSQPNAQSSLNVRCVAYDPNDPFHFFIGTDNKVIFNFARDKGWSYTGPQTYKAQGLPVEIICEQFSPFDPKIFLAGLSNGHLLFFKVERSQPILRLNHSETDELPVTFIEFSPTVATKFYSICAKRYFFEWDLDRSKMPVLTCDLLQCCSSTVESAVMWLQQRSKQQYFILLALGLTNGELQLHKIGKGTESSVIGNLAETITRLITAV